MIKNFFKFTGLLVLVCVSFFYTEKAMVVIREQDPLMIEIMEKKDSYYKDAIPASIKNKDIIPGYRGIEVDINASYENMKKYGIYNEGMLKYKSVIPSTSIDNIFDKYIISGNKVKNSISLVFNVTSSDDISKIVEILGANDVLATFFFDKEYIESNKDFIKELYSLGHDIGHTSYLNPEEISYVNRLLSNNKVKSIDYCYAEDYDDDLLNTCKTSSMHAVKPTIINSNNMTISLKKEIDSGSILSIPINKNTNERLDHMIKTIKQKGYKLITISKHLTEKD